MFTLYWEYLAGSIVVQAMLEEVGADYQLHYIDMGAGEHHGTAFQNINPACRIPALRCPDGSTIGETSAIITLLGEMFPNSALTPQPGTPDRAAFLFWLSVMATAGYITSGRVAHPERFAHTEDAIGQVQKIGAADYDAFFDMMEQNIAGTPYFMSHGITVLDFYLVMLAEWHGDRTGLLGSHPKLRALCTAVEARPSYVATMKVHALP